MSHNLISSLEGVSTERCQRLYVYDNPLENYPVIVKNSGGECIIPAIENGMYDNMKSYSSVYVVDCPLEQQVKIETVLEKWRTTFVSAAEAEMVKQEEKEELLGRIE